ncbi:MAG: GNAT family N-acetyltransferase [Clostridia bacterium]|nr:GNAT family N-acetyltransferase [Clostridia bacterium]
MIRLIENKTADLDFVCSHDVFGTRILSYFNTYGAKFDFLKVWVQYDESGAPCGAISLMDADMTLTCNENADFEELEFFIKATPFSSLQCQRDVMKKIGLTESIWGYVVRYEKPQPVKEADISFFVDYKKMYSLISGAKLIGVGEYLPWLSDISYRVNHGTAITAGIMEGENLSACAAVLFVAEHSALLGAVATAPHRRGNGFGGAIVKTLGNKMLKEGKRTELLCKNDSIVEFYKSLGFIIADQWGIKYN